MAIDPEVVEKVRHSALELALLRARLECASPEERERLLQARNGVRPPRVEEFADALDEAEWAQFLAEYKAERQGSGAEWEALVEEARRAADEEVKRRMRAGTLLAG